MDYMTIVNDKMVNYFKKHSILCGLMIPLSFILVLLLCAHLVYFVDSLIVSQLQLNIKNLVTSVLFLAVLLFMIHVSFVGMNTKHYVWDKELFERFVQSECIEQKIEENGLIKMSVDKDGNIYELIYSPTQVFININVDKPTLKIIDDPKNLAFKTELLLPLYKDNSKNIDIDYVWAEDQYGLENV